MSRKAYSIPVFHVVNANKIQIETVFSVIITLIESHICSCMVRRDEEDHSHVLVEFFGNIPLTEKKAIFQEVVNTYESDRSIRRISVDEES